MGPEYWTNHAQKHITETTDGVSVMLRYGLRR